VLVRDYKEAIARHYKMIKSRVELRKIFLNETAGKSRNGVDYIKILEFYDELEDDKRLLIYYEDLIINPQKSIVDTIDFLNVDHTYVDDFFKNYKFHQAQGVMSYHDTSYTGGQARLKKHQSALPDALLNSVTNSIKARHGHIFSKYLKRYE